MSEKNANSHLRGDIQLGDRLDRVENVVGTGMPDVNGCFEGYEFWIETKQPDEPKREGTALFASNHPVSQDQKNWMLKQINAGGNAFFYIVTDNWRLLVHGMHADKLNEMTVGQIGRISIGNWKVGQYKRGAIRAVILQSCRANALLRAKK